MRTLLAVGGGLLLTSAFPSIGVAGAAWVGPGVILFSALGCRGRRAFWLGYLAGFVHFLSSLYWLLAMPYTFHGVPLAPGCAWAALSAYCALYPALWVWLCWRIWPARGGLDEFFSAGVLRRGLWAWQAGVMWAGLEMMRGWFLTGFPWNFLGVSQYKMLPLIQIASVTGVYGVSFLVAWVSVALAMAVLALAKRPGRGVWSEVGVPMLTAAVVVGFGAMRTAKIPPADHVVTVALVQPGFAQTLIWNADQDKARLEKVMELSEKALEDDPNVLVWPEGVVPPLPPEQDASLSAVLGLSDHRTSLVASTDDVQPSPEGKPEYFNSCVMITPQGQRKGVYHKRRLVVFGEYVPWWLSFLKWVVPMDGMFTLGKDPVQFALRNPVAHFSVLICFEDVFGAEAREHVGADTDFLINLTNDGWFGNGAASWQQAASAVFRAVENGVPLIRCTNNGLTCWIDAQGRVREFFSVAGNIYTTGTLTVKVPLRAPGDHARTIYNLYGDCFGWTGLGLTVVFAAGTIRRREKVA